tara:strand:- start:62 stop:490 length:429 start_codon:yes stop_codon:yes gene_type:complete
MAEALCKQSPEYEFTFIDGSKIKRNNLITLVNDVIGDGAKETKDIAKEIGMAYQPVFSILRALTTADALTSERYGRVTMFRKPNGCALANLLYPLSIVDKLKVNSSKSYSMNNFPNISYRSHSWYEGFSGNYNNTIYEGSSY